MCVFMRANTFYFIIVDSINIVWIPGKTITRLIITILYTHFFRRIIKMIVYLRWKIYLQKTCNTFICFFLNFSNLNNISFRSASRLEKEPIMFCFM